MKLARRNKSEKIRTREVTTEFVLRDRTGSIVPLWNETALGKFLRTRFNFTKRIFGLGFYAPVLRTHNIITNVGHAGANGRMSNQGSYSPFVNLALGTGTLSVGATDMALFIEATGNGSNRVAATASQVTTSVTNDTTQLVHTWNFTTSFAITEEGIFDGTTAPVQNTINNSGGYNASATSLTVTANSIVNNDYVQWEQEIIQVTSGGGTTTLTVVRAQKGTSAASHANGTTLNDITANGNNLLAHQGFSAVNVNNGDSLQCTHKVQT
jgi:hypothetical protein